MLAECDRVCPFMGEQIELALGIVIEKDHPSINRWKLIALGTKIFINFGSSAHDCLMAYKLLGLEARDAVEAERENYKALEALMIQRNEQINAERARDAKLVEAVKKQINNLHWDDYAISVGESLERAIAAHKEGGAQG